MADEIWANQKPVLITTSSEVQAVKNQKPVLVVFEGGYGPQIIRLLYPDDVKGPATKDSIKQFVIDSGYPDEKKWGQITVVVKSTKIAWFYVEVPGTTPPVAEWMGGGVDTVSPFINGAQGTIYGVARDGYVEHLGTDTDGVGHVHGFDKKLDKADTASIVYGTDSSKNQTTIAYDINATSKSIVQRDVNGRIYAESATSDSHVVNKKQMDDALALKLDKLTSTSGLKAYIRSGSTDTSMDMVQSTATANTIPVRGTDGVVKVGTAVADLDAVNKKQFDTELAKKLSKQTTDTDNEYAYSFDKNHGSEYKADITHFVTSPSENDGILVLPNHDGTKLEVDVNRVKVYLKKGEVSVDGRSFVVTKQDNTTVTFTPKVDATITDTTIDPVQGKIVKAYIDAADTLLGNRITALEQCARCLGGWNSITGKSIDLLTGYSYKANDYYIVKACDKPSDYPEYDSTKSYVANDKCSHNNKFYICKESTTGAFDASKWNEHNITNYRPQGTASKEAASTEIETSELAVNDFYRYDGAGLWVLYHFSEGKVKDVQVDGTTVVDNKGIAKIDLTKKVDRSVKDDEGATNTIDNSKAQMGSVMSTILSDNDTMVSFNTASENGKDGILGQIYAKSLATGEGMRFNITTKGIYYNVGSSTPIEDGYKLVVKKDIEDKLDKVKTVTTKAQVYVKAADGTQTMADLPEGSVVDTEMSDTSVNAVQNKVIKKYVDDENLKQINLLGKEAVSGEEYHFPYHIDDLKFDTTDDKIKGKLFTITLDNKKTLTQYPLEVSIPKSFKANDGLMSKEDKVKLDSLKEVKYIELTGLDGSTGTLTDEQINILKENELNYIWLNGMHMLTFKYKDTGNNKATYCMSDLSSDGIKYHSVEIDLTAKTYTINHGKALKEVNTATTNDQMYIKKKDGTNELRDIPEGATIDTAMSDTSTNAVQNKVIKKYVDDKDVFYITLSGTSGTLTESQRATLLRGQPTNNFIDKDNMIFKCVYYSAGVKAVYSISGESKVHVITVTLPAGTWNLVTYELIQLLGNEAVSGDPYHFPYHFETKFEDGKIKITLYTITLDNNKILKQFEKELDISDLAKDKVGVGNVEGAKIWAGTKAEYDAIAAKDEATLYYVVDDATEAQGAMNFKGTCLFADLPTSGQKNGDYWVLTDTTGEHVGQAAIWSNTSSEWKLAGATLTVDSSLNLASTNAIQNKVVTAALNGTVKLTGDQNITGIKKFGEIWVGETNEYTKLFKDSIKHDKNGIAYEYSYPNKSGTFALTSDLTAIMQTVYDGMHPVNDVQIGFQAPAIPTGVTATWTDISSSYEGRYFKISSTSAAGTSEAESLPLPTVSINSAGDHNHDRGDMNITGLLRTAPSADSNVGDTMSIKHASGAFYNAGTAGGGSQRIYDINASYSRDTNVSTIGFNAASNWTGTTSVGGSHTHTATVSGSVYSSGAAVKPLTTTIKVWKRIA